MFENNPLIAFLLKLWNGFVSYLPTLLIALIVFAVGCILNSVIMKLMGKGLEKSRLDKTIHKFLNSLVKIAMMAFILIIVLTVLGIPMDSIIAVVSSAGIAVGLAMQSSLANVAGGFMVLIGRTFKVGDYVEIGGKEGTVDEISILSTKIITPDNKDIYIPNGTVVNSVVTNFSAEKSRRIDQIYGISYDNDVRKAIKVIEDVVAANEMIHKDPAPFVRLIECAGSSLNIVVRVWTDSADYWTVYFDLLENIKEAFDKNDIVIPYNQLDVHVVDNK
ncbi:MAG: mechanosensitive ion channel family protein [Oscillospiraceae bacterium]